MYLEILLTIWFIFWLFTKIGLFPDYIKNSWDTAEVKQTLDMISKQIDRLIVQVTLTEVEKKAYAETRTEEYELFMKELKRYEGCFLKELGFHTTSDRTSKSSGDIEVFKNDKLIESVEIKHNIEINIHILNRVIEKIKKFNPKRYFIISTSGVKEDDRNEILSKINTIRKDHGCQIITGDFFDFIESNLRIINDSSKLINRFTDNVLSDKELKLNHKDTWRALLKNY